MYEEPYRWIEAVANRRNYLDDQFIQGNPLIGVSFAQGILLLTFNRGTEKIYEIYDRIALGGMGHPADLEKLRYTLLDMAHVEGFQRSPADVTASRLMKNGLAPVIKQAFEEIFKAPHIPAFLWTACRESEKQSPHHRESWTRKLLMKRWSLPFLSLRKESRLEVGWRSPTDGDSVPTYPATKREAPETSIPLQESHGWTRRLPSCQTRVVLQTCHHS